MKKQIGPVIIMAIVLASSAAARQTGVAELSKPPADAKHFVIVPSGTKHAGAHT